MIKIETKKDYQNYVDKVTPNSKTAFNVFKAFIVGGLICIGGQIILDFWTNLPKSHSVITLPVYEIAKKIEGNGDIGLRFEFKNIEVYINYESKRNYPLYMVVSGFVFETYKSFILSPANIICQIYLLCKLIYKKT